MLRQATVLFADLRGFSAIAAAYPAETVFELLKRWFEAIRQRGAVQAAYAVAETINTAQTMTEDAKAILFGQGRRTKR